MKIQFKGDSVIIKIDRKDISEIGMNVDGIYSHDSTPPAKVVIRGYLVDLECVMPPKQMKEYSEFIKQFKDGK